MPCYENAAGHLIEEPAGYLRTVWSSNTRRPGEAQQLFEHMAQTLRRNNWSRILIDQRHMQPFTPAEQRWVASQWLPLAVLESGYRHGAVLVSPKVLVRLATAYVTTHVRGLPLVYRSFEISEEAEAWLLRQPPTA